MRADIRFEGGFSAVWVALVMLFILGSAAIAVDASGAFQTARTDQTTADLSCLAGVKELPKDQDAAINIAAAYVELNWPQMAGATLTKTLPTATLDDGNGNIVEFDASYDGDNAKMWVGVTGLSDTWFANVLGADSITVSQEAWCRVENTSVGGGLPFGATPGGFNGDLQNLNPCETGNCGPLFIPRDDVKGGGPTLIRNIAEGPDRLLEASWGSSAKAVDCASVSAGGTCHIVETDTGVSAAHLGEGMLQRLEDTLPPADCTFIFKGSRIINCDTPTDVLGSQPTPLASRAVGWDDDLHGDFDMIDTSNHYSFAGPTIAKCDSPRLGFMPIVSQDLEWAPGLALPPFPNGKKDVKVVGFYWVIIRDPNDANDWKGSGTLKVSTIDIIWFDPGVEYVCDNGDPFDPANPAKLVKTVLLVNDTN